MRISQTAFLLLFLVLFLYVLWPYGSPQVAELRQGREFVDAETMLRLDPLLSLAVSLASRTLVAALAWAGVVLLFGVIFPRVFCGYVCPLGTLIDLWDWAVARRVRRFRACRHGHWVHVKYYLLAAVLVAALCGGMVAGYVAPIALLTRGLLVTLAPLEVGLTRGWNLVPLMHLGHALAAVPLLGVLILSFLGPRFWCRYVCPTGALFSLAARLRLTDRKVSEACVRCGRCRASCPFDAIRDDFTTRGADCTFCQICGGACPVGAIQFTHRWDRGESWKARQPDADDGVSLSRRGFLVGAAGGLAGFAVTRYVRPAARSGDDTWTPVRPPGSVPEEQFLQQCIRCGECMKACPNHCLQPLGFRQGLEGLWTPHVVADWTGCHENCNNCGQVCPTGAIRALDLAEKRVVRIGRAVVNEKTCLPHSGKAACRLCHDQCATAGYGAIEFIRLHVELDEDGLPVEDTGFDAPVVDAEKCVGCGQCQSRCHAVNVVDRDALAEAAIVTRAGQGRDDRLTSGSYLELREAERRRRQQQQKNRPPEQGTYLPDYLK
ncbi:MAG: 4Fe-4S binding protein [Planctomycetes bacterium]|nr:4Fe-4S binding protein [Planctomycetota bacterium]